MNEEEAAYKTSADGTPAIAKMDMFCTPEYVSKLVTESYMEGLERGKTISVQRMIHMQPYEIATKVSVDTDSKLQTKPSAEVKITRRLKKVEEVSECIKADLSRGVEECMIAINEILRKAKV